MSNQTSSVWQCTTPSAGPNSIDRITFYFADVREAKEGAERMTRLFRRPIKLKKGPDGGVYVSWDIPWIVRTRLEEYCDPNYPQAGSDSIYCGSISWSLLADMTTSDLITIVRDEKRADQLLLEDYDTNEAYERGLYGFSSAETYDDVIDQELREKFGLPKGPINQVIEEFCRSITKEDEPTDGIPF